MLLQVSARTERAERLTEALTLAPTKWPLQTKLPAPQPFLPWPLQKAAAMYYMLQTAHEAFPLRRQVFVHVRVLEGYHCARIARYDAALC